MVEVDLRRVKYELLCYGVNCSLEVLNLIKEINPYASSNKSVHCAFFMLDDTLIVNTPINEEYTRQSPYNIRINSEQFMLFKDNREICNLTVVKPPKWYEKRTSNNTKMYDVLSVHNKNVLALTHYVNCYYLGLGKRCLYCSVQGSKIPQLADLEIREQDIVETLIEALKENNEYSLALSEGVKNRVDCGAVYFSTILQKILESGVLIKSSVELAPPSNNSYINMLRTSGATSIIMNMEFYDEDVRKIYCPGKGEISNTRYLDALSYSVKIFGKGNVASVLIAGVESKEKTITGAKLLLDLGVLPIIVPFKPYDNCRLRNMSVTQFEEIETIISNIEGYFRRINFENICSSTCVSCGACNIDYYNFKGIVEYA